MTASLGTWPMKASQPKSSRNHAPGNMQVFSAIAFMAQTEESTPQNTSGRGRFKQRIGQKPCVPLPKAPDPGLLAAAHYHCKLQSHWLDRTNWLALYICLPKKHLPGS